MKTSNVLNQSESTQNRCYSIGDNGTIYVNGFGNGKYNLNGYDNCIAYGIDNGSDNDNDIGNYYCYSWRL